MNHQGEGMNSEVRRNEAMPGEHVQRKAQCHKPHAEIDHPDERLPPDARGMPGQQPPGIDDKERRRHRT